MAEERFVFLDGDGIGDHIELLLLDGKLSEAIALSQSISSAMRALRDLLQSIPGAKVKLYGGDDLIATFQEEPHLAQLNQLRHKFLELCGCTISIGVGASIQEALTNLRRAKLSGKDSIVGIETLKF